MPSWHRLLWQCRQWPVSAAVSEHTVPKNYLKYKNKTGKEALPFITEFLETTECLGDAWDWDRAPEKVWFRSLLPNYKWLHGKQRGWRYPRENTSTEKQSCLHKQLWEGDAELAQGGHAACEQGEGESQLQVRWSRFEPQLVTGQLHSWSWDQMCKTDERSPTGYTQSNREE